MENNGWSTRLMPVLNLSSCGMSFELSKSDNDNYQHQYWKEK